jgi:hypothetical protein
LEGRISTARTVSIFPISHRKFDLSASRLSFSLVMPVASEQWRTSLAVEAARPKLSSASPEWVSLIYRNANSAADQNEKSWMQYGAHNANQ